MFLEGSWNYSVEARLNPLHAANLISRCGALETAMAGKANVGHSHAWADITGVPSIPAAQVPSDWNLTAGVARILNKPRKVFPFKATVSGGNAVFYLTNDGTAGGTPFFASGPDLDSMQLTAEEGAAPHTYGTPVLSNSNKTLTVPVNKAAGINVALLGLTLLGAPAAANGSIIRLLIAGAS